MSKRGLLGSESERSDDLELARVPRSYIKGLVEDSKQKEEKIRQKEEKISELSITLKACSERLAKLTTELDKKVEGIQNLEQQLEEMKDSQRRKDIEHKQNSERMYRDVEMGKVCKTFKEGSKDKQQFFGDHDNLEDNIRYLSLILTNIESIIRMRGEHKTSNDEVRFLEIVAKLFFIARAYKDKPMGELKQIGGRERWGNLEEAKLNNMIQGMSVFVNRLGSSERRFKPYDPENIEAKSSCCCLIL